MSVASTAPSSAPPTPAKRPVSLEQFLLRYSGREDAYKYEWNNGVIEKKPRTMNRDQFYILQILMRVFTRTRAYADMGELICEVDMFLPTVNRTRRADIAYLSGQQMRASKDGRPTVCAFVVEIISKNDQAIEVAQKIQEYFDNGVQVVWVIFPKLKKVEVLRSVRDVTVCLGSDLCSAAPVLPDFEITANKIFEDVSI